MTTDHRIEFCFAGKLGEVVPEFVESRRFGGTLATATAAATGSDFGCFTEHSNHLGANFRQVDPQVFEHASCNSLSFANQTQKKMLCSDVVMTELPGFFE